MKLIESPIEPSKLIHYYDSLSQELNGLSSCSDIADVDVLVQRHEALWLVCLLLQILARDFSDTFLSPSQLATIRRCENQCQLLVRRLLQLHPHATLQLPDPCDLETWQMTRQNDHQFAWSLRTEIDLSNLELEKEAMSLAAMANTPIPGEEGGEGKVAGATGDGTLALDPRHVEEQAFQREIEILWDSDEINRAVRQTRTGYKTTATTPKAKS